MRPFVPDLSDGLLMVAEPGELVPVAEFDLRNMVVGVDGEVVASAPRFEAQQRWPWHVPERELPWPPSELCPGSKARREAVRA